MIAAIDLGASTTKVAIIRDGAREPELVRFGAVLDFPTLVFLGNNQQLLVGNQALNMAGRNQSRLVTQLKQQIKRRDSVLPVQAFVDVPGRPVLVVDAVAAVLAHAYKRVLAALGEAPQRVVLTYPVVWGSDEQELLEAAARAAGIDCPLIFRSEPLAAAGFHRGLIEKKTAPIAVFDLGASTFDSVILARNGVGDRVPQWSYGEPVGGDDFDLALMAMVDDHLDDADQELFRKLQAERYVDVTSGARVTKERLSHEPEAKFAFEGLSDDVTVYRNEFEEAIRPFADQCVWRLKEGLAALKESGTVGTIIMSGGSSRVPLVRQLVEDAAREAGATVITPGDEVNPGHMVVLGALRLEDPAVSPSPPAPATPTAPAVVPEKARDEEAGAGRAAERRDTAPRLSFGMLLRPIKYLDSDGKEVATSSAGNRMAVWRGDIASDADASDGIKLADLWRQTSHEDASWHHYTGPPIVRSFHSERGYKIYAGSQLDSWVTAIGRRRIPHCGWLDGAPVALIYQSSWSAFVELDGLSEARLRPRTPLPRLHEELPTPGQPHWLDSPELERFVVVPQPPPFRAPVPVTARHKAASHGE
jgi:actin-like ATPase involved in cell morphogenesis